MRLSGVAFAALLSVSFAAVAQEALDGRLKKIRDAQTITVAYRTDATPFSFEDSNNQATGYTVDFVDASSARSSVSSGSVS